jgi:hypothetical protein
MTILGKWCAPIILIVALFAGATQPAPAFADKTRFVLHLGIAYFCFHHWVLAPYQAGAFAPGAPRVHRAQEIAAKSNDPLLKKLNGEVIALSGAFLATGERLRAGHFDPADIAVLEGQATALGRDASAGDANVKDVPVALPGT